MARLSRLFLPGPIPVSGPVSLDETASHHAVRVLRLRVGEAVELFNGDGCGYRGALSAADPRAAQVRIDSVTAAQPLPVPTLELVQAVAATDRMDWVIEKAVELGAHRIQPLATQRSVVRYDTGRAHRREEHWRRIVVAACMQCGRNRLPEIGPITPLLSWSDWDAGAQTGMGMGMGTDGSTHRLILLPEAATPIGSVPFDAAKPAAHIRILVGPEGGFEPQEARAAIDRGWHPVRLGAWVLRTETAGLAMLAALQTRLSLWS